MPVLLVLIFLLGPRAEEVTLDPILDPVLIPIEKLEAFISERESLVSHLKPDNEAVIVWRDSLPQKTANSLVYLHGFSASRGEGDPVHIEFAQKYGMNAYLPRLDQHGLKEQNALGNLTAESLLESAKQALSVGAILGEKVILMTCSTGSTLGLYLAAHHPDLISGVICFSPNIDLQAAGSSMLDGPWGLQILRMVEGGDFHQWEAPEAALPFWTTSYRIEALIELRQLIDGTMTRETFNQIKQPVHVQYFFKSEEVQDQVVSVKAMHEMFSDLGTPEGDKTMVAIPEAEQHVFVSKYYDCDLTSVRKNLHAFAEQTLGLTPMK